MLGRYALYGELASGGMATVHFGRLLGPVGFNRTVAIKRLHPQLAKDPEFVAMFLDEARLAARIHHPNVASTLDVIATEGELLLVMEYVHGESLARLLRLGREAPPPIDVTVAILVGTLHGLHAAHEAKNERGEPLNLVHRDVSPQNVLIGSDGVPRVLDFGVAKAIGRTQTTEKGTIKGKFAYMSPEQLRGSVGRTADVYACAVMLWEALTGRRLYSGEPHEVMSAKLVESPIAPPSRYAVGIPAVLDAITLKGLAFDPRERFQTAHEMACVLEDLPMAPPSKLARWVEQRASASLSERALQVADIEKRSPAELTRTMGGEWPGLASNEPRIAGVGPARPASSPVDVAVAVDAAGDVGAKASPIPIEIETATGLATSSVIAVEWGMRRRNGRIGAAVLGAVAAALLVGAIVKERTKLGVVPAQPSAAPSAIAPATAPRTDDLEPGATPLSSSKLEPAPSSLSPPPVTSTGVATSRAVPSQSARVVSPRPGATVQPHARPDPRTDGDEWSDRK
jgi:serine/threonine-protein kinase